MGTSGRHLDLCGGDAPIDAVHRDAGTGRRRPHRHQAIGRRQRHRRQREPLFRDDMQHIPPRLVAGQAHFEAAFATRHTHRAGRHANGHVVHMDLSAGRVAWQRHQRPIRAQRVGNRLAHLAPGHRGGDAHRLVHVEGHLHLPRAGGHVRGERRHANVFAIHAHRGARWGRLKRHPARQWREREGERLIARRPHIHLSQQWLIAGRGGAHSVAALAQ